MRIISKFQDYYDGIQSYGQDMSLIYHRVSDTRRFREDSTEEVFGQDIELYGYVGESNHNKSQWTPGLESIERMYIGICGIMYPIIKVSYEGDNRTTPYPHDIVKYISSTEGLLKLLTELSVTIKCKASKILVDSWDTVKHIPKYRRRYSFYQDRPSKTAKRYNDDFFNLNGSDKYRQYSVDEKIVCFVLKNTENGQDMDLIINPCLKDYGGPVVSNPFDTFQNISMFLGGVLGNEAAPMIKIEDKYRIESHGYNKYSFRTRPTTKK